MKSGITVTTPSSSDCSPSNGSRDLRSRVSQASDRCLCGDRSMSPGPSPRLLRDTGVMDQAGRDDDRPAWARRIRRERTARGWSQAAAIRALRAHTDAELVEDSSLLRNWKRWEAGGWPDDFYRP